MTPEAYIVKMLGEIHAQQLATNKLLREILDELKKLEK